MDRRQIIRSYFTSRHLDNKKLRVLFIEPIVEEFGLMSDYVEMIQLFGSVNRIPDSFLEDLGDSLAYEFMQEEDYSIQREIIKRILNVYKNRSMRESVEKVLKYSTDRNWVGDNLTLYKGDLKEGYQNIWIPRDRIFYHDKSTHDGGDCFMDHLTYNYGIIGLEMQYFDDRTLEMLEKQIPGGIRWIINQLVWFEDTEGKVPQYKTDFTEVDYEERLDLLSTDVYLVEEIARFDQLSKVIGELPVQRVKLNGGKLGSNDQVLRLNGGKLGESFGKVIDGGWIGRDFDFSIYQSWNRSGRRVVDLTIDEEYITGSTYLDGWNVLNAGRLGEPISRIRYNGGKLGSNDQVLRLNGGKLGDFRTSINSFLTRKTFGVDVDEEIFGYRKFDVDEHDNGKSRDGVDTPEITIMARYRELLPSDLMYDVNYVMSECYGDNADSLTKGFQVEEF